ncbi:WD40-repeat-containing domain protein [Rhodocollybia butyracea]|uniref:DNA damage-binding protein CMR1 n=1 Tax=Rhodocollybia butyracea TaxID=206335 RepID=A0A9P5Q6C5_9AGAR|nr:WD40-repeat-containing domain protein [Rhodocollybia butyracea]
MAKSAYEREREANIARNRALFEQLELKQAVDTLGFPAKEAPSKPKAKPVQPAKKTKKEPEAPRRQSARLRGAVVDPNESPSRKRKREEEEEERLAEERIEAQERERLNKRPRHNDLDLAALTDEDATQFASLSTQLETLSQTAQSRRPADTEAFVFEQDVKDQAEVEELRQKLQNMKVVARAKVTENRIYSAAYHPDPTKDLIFFGDKHGQLGMWDARATPDEVDDDKSTSDTQENGKYWRLQVHWPATSKSSISSVKLDPIDSHTVYTSAYDCTVRALSFTSGVSREIFSNDDTMISSIDVVPSGNEMWISDVSGGVTHLDLRQDKSKGKWYQLSEQKIGCVSVNPTRPNFLLTASNSKELRIWDVRKLLTIVTDLSLEESTSELASDVVTKYRDSKNGSGLLRGEWRHNKSVSSAYWDPRGRSIVSTSYDDAIRLWDFHSPIFESVKPFPTSKPFCRISHNCQTGKWLTIFRAQWTQNPDVYPHFTIGNMNHSLDIISCKGERIARLSDSSKISAVQAVTCSHPSIVERAATGNASGRCVLWAPGDTDN